MMGRHDADQTFLEPLQKPRDSLGMVLLRTKTHDCDAFLREAIAGLTRHPKRLPGKFLWDEAGSVLFDRICDAPDYYPTGSEMALLPEVAHDLALRIGPGATIVEFGSGASRKIRALLDALEQPARYVAISSVRSWAIVGCGSAPPPSGLGLSQGNPTCHLSFQFRFPRLRTRRSP